MADAKMRVFRGTQEQHTYKEYTVPLFEGMVVLDAMHHIQASDAHDMAVRWNCKAGKCGSCSAEVNGKPRLMCMTRMDQFPAGETITVEPMRRFPLIRDLVTNVSWNYEVNKKIPPLKPKPREADGTYRMMQYDIDRIQEFHKCIECFLCQDVCHVMRDHQKYEFAGPRFMVRLASLAMHPLDTHDRLRELKDVFGVGYCNITKCCTEVCPEDIHITDNAIIPLKERVAGAFYDPLAWLWRAVRGKKTDQKGALH
ncbi:MAG: succinate dehydrogenase/fumarate reductase iron-sulfur subunit [Candidatus Lambdaproteobacteria bacterium]|nr:succinate dehydrogenase/fumarate reductase iron-sulfur subunit [Candidatus Lambdaproteobacteria bacterium]